MVDMTIGETLACRERENFFLFISSFVILYVGHLMLQDIYERNIALHDVSTGASCLQAGVSKNFT
jgi:hypothetical protein